jgi:hypothetical protein
MRSFRGRRPRLAVTHSPIRQVANFVYQSLYFDPSSPVPSNFVYTSKTF